MSGKVVSFRDFRTIDASLLCKAVTIVSLRPLPDGFEPFFDDLRKQRNKIAHLNGGNIRVEAKGILVDILKAYQFLFPGERWLNRYRRHSEMLAASVQDPHAYDPTHSDFLAMVRIILDTLEAEDARLLLGYDSKLEDISCPECQGRRVKWDDMDAGLAQRLPDGRVSCIGCGTVFSEDAYEKACGEYFGE